MYVLIEADQLQYVLPTPLALLPPTVWIVGSLCPILGSLIVWQEAVYAPNLGGGLGAV